MICIHRSLALFPGAVFPSARFPGAVFPGAVFPGAVFPGARFPGAVALCLGLTTPALHAQFAPGESVSVTQPQRMDAADIDGDGDMDVLVAVEPLNAILVLRNEGAGVLAPGGLLSGAEGGGTDVHPVDLDGDGDPDLLYTNQSADRVGWIENLGAGTFGSPTSLSNVPDLPRHVNAGDLDGDGDLDVVCSAFLDQAVYWLENTGGLAFAPPQAIATGISNAEDLALADFDQDGDLDVAVEGNGVRWLDNQGGGQFVTHMVGGHGALFSQLQAVDVDEDGDSDLFGASGNLGWSLWFENLGGGSFQSHSEFCVVEPFDVMLHDMNGDGKLDIVGNTFTQIFWCENRGGGDFQDRERVGTLPAIGQRILAVDLDGDQDSEVLMGLSTPGVLRFENLVRAGLPTCAGITNSTGSPSTLFAQGSHSVTLGLLSLQADAAPPGQFGIFFAGPDTVQVPFGDGERCVGGSTLRLGTPVLEQEGLFATNVDWGLYGLDLGAMGTSYLQCWYRDPAAAGTGFNLSSGLELGWRP